MRNGYISQAESPQNETEEGDSALVGIILCFRKDEALVKYATIGLTQQVFVSKYLINLLKEKELKEVIEIQR